MAHRRGSLRDIPAPPTVSPLLLHPPPHLSLIGSQAKTVSGGGGGMVGCTGGNTNDLKGRRFDRRLVYLF